MPKDTSLEMLFELLVVECTATGGHITNVVEGLLKALLAKILCIATPNAATLKPKADLYEAYHELLNRDGRLRNNVAHYAQLLNTTPQNLNASCRKTVDQAASEVLASYIISEAKRLLTYTENTVAEIAYALSFKDASHFVKYFKRYTNSTPQGFRNQ
jgi:AraC-like DNA-binding protein